MIEGIKYDGRPVESVLEPVDAEGNKVPQVAITYGDDKEPKQEIMSSDEWSKMQQKSDDDRPRGFYLQDATYNLRKNVMLEFEKFNPRYTEIARILNSINDDCIGQLKDGALNLTFGCTNWQSELTFDHIFRVTKEAGKEMEHGELTPDEIELVEFLASKKFPISTIPRMLSKIMYQADYYQNKAMENAIGIPFQNIRLDDVVQHMEKKLAKRKNEEEEEKVAEEETGA